MDQRSDRIFAGHPSGFRAHSLGSFAVRWCRLLLHSSALPPSDPSLESGRQTEASPSSSLTADCATTVTLEHHCAVLPSPRQRLAPHRTFVCGSSSHDWHRQAHGPDLCGGESRGRLSARPETAFGPPPFGLLGCNHGQGRRVNGRASAPFALVGAMADPGEHDALHEAEAPPEQHGLCWSLCHLICCPVRHPARVGATTALIRRRTPDAVGGNDRWRVEQSSRISPLCRFARTCPSRRCQASWQSCRFFPRNLRTILRLTTRPQACCS